MWKIPAEYLNQTVEIAKLKQHLESILCAAVEGQEFMTKIQLIEFIEDECKEAFKEK